MSAAGGPVTVSIIRHLKESGHRVLGIDSRSDAVGRFFCDAFRVAPVATDRPAYLAFMDSLAGEFDLFMPFIDEELLAIADSLPLPQELVKRIIISSPGTVRTCTDKHLFQQFAIHHDLPVPSLAERPPAIIKPRIGRGGQGLIRAEEADLISYFSKQPGYVCQNQVQGIEYSVDVLVDKKGDWVFGVARRRIQAKGVSIVGQIDMAEDVLDAARRITSVFDFKGPINLQFIRERSGRIWVIEINPRLSGSVMFTTLAGFDVLNATIELFLDGQRPANPAIRNGLKIFRYWEEYAVP